MRSVHRQIAVASVTVIMAIAGILHGPLIGAATAAHLAEHRHDDDVLDHDDHAAIELILHGHDHEPGTPDHRHPLVTAKPAPQHVKRPDLPDPPDSVSHVIRASTPEILRSLRLQPELCGPGPPSLSQSLVVLRI